MRYKNLLFDVDNTLLDFHDAEQQALKALFNELGVPLTPENETLYKTINQKRWEEHEKGNLTSDEVVNGRFGLFFERLGKKVDSVKTEQRYRQFLNQGHKRIGNSLEIIRDLSAKADLYVVTNGLANTQFQRLTDAKLYPYFKDIFISEQAGFQKPMIEFFDYVFTQAPHLQKEETVIIGDSLTSDIQGGKNAGIDTIWFNPIAAAADAKIKPTFQISRLEDIYDVLASPQ
ncbi:YjjG family noncanonical pyrimidine nucleotidase [Tetragenococcus koreensis]|uniref:HAD family hydrolase n=1 Tax=Tetragenococcus koreensis TaxID=290335 RepID=A0AAN4RIN9_9ENTE|nr:YjjG family noncanonical pyrimidine nucleotidase [Tetragenococcus koreensis]AYW46182.1 noncanonical pyrimidine nucleotidase, YjjG family [Tetragenococcus koreensis]MCF1584923.1 YjjG family noncanonical pyrimidine nucleotidase [Tetragenococcus koreensis]MCF1614436.1 YjjG family noncanonical pyrimidine nucleotidase [Tetragenococcus koreensis]MCF1617254.1 YjjG family noncanonical pyrimidine nucleotidase [Tetragenococcus koreensis]MCF1619839.1 YjjG family noncanonical pyrimidine nucleotidase [T